MELKKLFNFKKHKTNQNNFPTNPNHHYHVVGPTFKALFFFIIILVPVFVFTYILYNNEGLKDYNSYLYDGKHIWEYMDIPNGHRVFAFLWTGYGFVFLTIIGLIGFGFIVKNTKLKYVKSWYTIAIVLIAIVGVLLVSLSQYSYSKFYEFYQYEGLTTNVDVKQIWVRDLTITLTNDWTDTTRYSWEPSVVVWWIMFIQVAVIFSISVSLQNSIYSYSNEITDYDRYVEDSNKTEDISLNKMQRAFNSLFKTSDKNIASLIIIASVVIIIPNFVYAILMTVDGTNLNAMISWGYKVPDLLQDISYQKGNDVFRIIGELDSSYYGSLFPTVSLQIIFLGITISTTFLFVAISLRGRNISSRVFVFQSAIIFVELAGTIAIGSASKVDLHHMADFWMTSQNGKTNAQLFISELEKLISVDFAPLKSMFSLGKITDTKFNVEWLDMSATIAETIIAFTFIFGIFTMTTNGIYKLGYFKKSSTQNYKSGILNS